MVSTSNQSLRSPHQSALLRTLVVLVILAIAVFRIAPHYMTGEWAWAIPPQLNHIQHLKTLQQQGIALPGWRTLNQEVVEIGGHQWSVQSIVTAETDVITPQNTVWLLLRPQVWHRDLPQVDWMDITGIQQWMADSRRILSFTVPSRLPDGAPDPAHPISVKAQFFRGWNTQRTYAVLQWYAWSTGGDAAPSRWFWVDQWSQWHNRQRTPWVAVSMLIPIKPLGDITTAQSLAETLGSLIQTTLLTHTLP